MSMHQENIDTGNASFESYRQRITNFSNDFEFGVFVFLLRKSYWLLLLILVFAGMASYTYLRYTAKVYESSAVIQVNVTNQAASILNMTYGGDGTDELKTKVELMRSPLMIKLALKKMNSEVGYFTKGQILDDNKYGNNSFVIYDKII